jgi:hypothetical protein
MAITTMAGLRDGLQPPIETFKSQTIPGAAAFGKSVTNFYATGNPAAAAVPSPGINGASLTTYAGQVPWQNPASGSAYLAGIEEGMMPTISTANGAVMLADRLWHNSGLTVTTTTEQAITPPAWPARDRNGSTNGDGVVVAIEVTTVTGNAGAITNTTLNYTNSDGTAGRTGTITSFPITAPAGTVIPFELAAGDIGVRSIQGITLGTSYVSGVIHLVAFRVIFHYAIKGHGTLNSGYQADAIRTGLPRIYDNSVPYWLGVVAPSNAQTNHSRGMIQAAHG